MKKSVFILLLLAFMLFSCTNDSFLDAEMECLTEGEMVDYTPEEKLAINVFNDFLDEFSLKSSTRAKSVERPFISSVNKKSTSNYGGELKTRSDNEGMPIYEITFQNSDSSEGFAIVTETVLAYVPKGSITDTVFNVGLATWFEELSYMQNTPASVNAVSGDIWQEEWDTTVLPVNDNYEFYRMITNGEDLNQLFYFGPIHSSSLYSAFVETKWNQTSPYNNRVPYYIEGTNTRCKVGCFAVAIGQLMSYHRCPNSYNWDLLLGYPIIYNGSSAASEVSRLLYNIALYGGTQYKTETGAGTSDIFKVIPTLNHFGLNGTRNYLGNGMSSHITIEEIKQSRPILFAAQSNSGRGHIWVIDGVYEFYRWYYCPVKVMPHDGPQRWELHRVLTRGRLSHCNWGWGGLSNGWYYSFNPKNTEGTYIRFNIDKYIFTGITKK